MSDCAGSIYDKNEDFHVLLSKNDSGESPEHKHHLWMSHWTRAGSSAEPQNDKSGNRLEGISKGTSTRDSATLPFKFMKSTVAERVMVGVSPGGTSVQHAQQFTSSMMRNVTHDVCKELGTKNIEQGDQLLEKSMKQKDVNLHARAVISETYSIHKVSQLPLDFEKLGSSDNPSSDWSHFPMFEINRKIDNILNPKRRSSLGPASLNVNMCTSHMMALSSQENRMHSHQIADENMDMCKPAGAVVSHLEDPAGLSSDPSVQKLKGDLSDTLSCSCSKDDNDSSNCQIDEQHANNYFAISKNEPPYASSGKKFKFAGSKKNQIAVSAFHNQKSRTSAVHKQQNAAEVMYCAPVLGKEFQNEPKNCSNNRKHDGVHEMYKSCGNIVSSSLLPYQQRCMETQRMESAANLKDTYVLPDPIANSLTVNSNGVLQTHGKESMGKSTGFCKQKGPCLFETLTIPSKSQSMYPKNSASSGKSSALGVCMYGTNIGSRLFGAQNQSSAKTETLYSDTLIVSKSSAGIASPSAQKEYSFPNEARTEQLAVPPVRGDSGYNKENEFCDVHDISSKATIAKQPSVPGTGATNLDLILFQMSRMRNPISRGIVQPPVGAEPGGRWLNRLQLNLSDPEIPCSKRTKVGDSPLGEASCLFGMALHCDKGDAKMIDRFKEDQVLDSGSKPQDKQETPPVPAKSMNCWIGRWCQGGTPVFHEGPGQGRQAIKPDQASEELGGQFPSIAAMAMMGRAMNKLRPCERQKKGPFVVWKTE